MNYSPQKCSIKKSLSGTSYLLRKFRAYILIKPFNVYLKTLGNDEELIGSGQMFIRAHNYFLLPLYVAFKGIKMSAKPFFI